MLHCLLFSCVHACFCVACTLIHGTTLKVSGNHSYASSETAESCAQLLRIISDSVTASRWTTFKCVWSLDSSLVCEVSFAQTMCAVCHQWHFCHHHKCSDRALKHQHVFLEQPFALVGSFKPLQHDICCFCFTVQWMVKSETSVYPLHLCLWQWVCNIAELDTSSYSLQIQVQGNQQTTIADVDERMALLRLKPFGAPLYWFGMGRIFFRPLITWSQVRSKWASILCWHHTSWVCFKT